MCIAAEVEVNVLRVLDTETVQKWKEALWDANEMKLHEATERAYCPEYLSWEAALTADELSEIVAITGIPAKYAEGETK